MQIYIIDTTTNPPHEERFASYNDAVRYMDGMSKRAYGQTRKERMIMLEEIGHGYDDSGSVNFVRSMAEKFEMGVIRNNAGALNRMRCDITNLNSFASEEFGS
jgi:hypothetical protein